MTIKIEEVTNKRSPFAWMSSMYAQPLRYNNEIYYSAQALFQCLCVEKSNFNDTRKLEAIDRMKNTNDPKEIAKFWKQLRFHDGFTISEEIQLEIMRFCIELKLAQYPELKKKLALTNQEEISDASFLNNYWCHVKMGTGLIVGQNMNGKLLMAVRSTLLANEKYQIFLSEDEVKLVFVNGRELIVKMNYENLERYCVNIETTTGKVWKTLSENAQVVVQGLLKSLFMALKNEMYMGCEGFHEFFYKELMSNENIKEALDAPALAVDEKIDHIFEQILIQSVQKFTRLCIGKIKFEVRQNGFDPDSKKLLLKTGTMVPSTKESVEALLQAPIEKLNDLSKNYPDLFQANKKYEIVVSEDEIKLVFVNGREMVGKVEYKQIESYLASSKSTTGKVWKALLEDESVDGECLLKSLFMVLKHETYQGCEGFGEYFYKELMSDENIKKAYNAQDFWKDILNKEGLDSERLLKLLLMVLNDKVYKGCEGIGESFYQELMSNENIKEALDTPASKLDEHIDHICEYILNHSVSTFIVLCMGKIRFEVKADPVEQSIKKLTIKIGAMKQSTKKSVAVLLQGALDKLNHSSLNYPIIFQ
jgi:predicted NAD-dependent protein-ADP-ribosyltransferase YbiA (DUF1768 family)